MLLPIVNEILGYHSSEKYGNTHHMCNWKNDYLKLENMVCFFLNFSKKTKKKKQKNRHINHSNYYWNSIFIMSWWFISN